MALRTTEVRGERGGRQDAAREPVASRRALEPIAERAGASGAGNRVPYKLADFAASTAAGEVRKALAKAAGSGNEKLAGKLRAELLARESAAELTGKALEAIDAGDTRAAEALMTRANDALDSWEKKA